MPLRFDCSRCGKTLSVAENMLGKRVRCGGCSFVLVVEIPGKTPARDEEPPSRKTSSAKTSKPTPKKPRNIEDEGFTEPDRRVPRRDRSERDRSADDRPKRDRSDWDRPRRSEKSRQESRSNRKKPVPWILIGTLGGGGFLLVLSVGLLLAWSWFGAKDQAQLVQQNNRPEVLVNDNLPRGKEAGKNNDNQGVRDVAEAPLPQQLALEKIKTIKNATAFLKVTNGKQVSEGSGFFAVEPGIVLTNAHVLGMLRGTSKPSKVEVIVHSGEADEFRGTGEVLGVDQETDLAVVRLNGDIGRSPEPLSVDFAAGLTELQKVYIFGFPLGSQLGKNITVAESSISSLRKDAGIVEQIQVNGGMHPGNSGGPVVDTRGVVIGVAVAGIRGTQINFAVPSDKIQGLLHGRIRDSHWGEPYRDKEQIKLPVKLACVDPLQRIKEVKLELWTGPAGPARPASARAPTALPGDAARSTIPLEYRDGAVRGEIVLPSLPPEKVYWLQPVIVNATGASQWAAATALKPAHPTPLERTPADLTLNPEVAPERSLKLTGKFEVRVNKGSKEVTLAANVMNMHVLEVTGINTKGVDIKLFPGQGEFFTEAGERINARPQAAQDLVRAMSYSYTANPFGRIFIFGSPIFSPKVPFEIRRQANELAELFSSSYQAVSLSVPNRQVAPLETWPATVPLMIDTGRKKDFVDLELKCTYEGCRQVNGQSEATIGLIGELKNRTPRPFGQAPSKDRVSGRALFNVSSRFFTRVQLAVRTDIEEDGVFLARHVEFELNRTAGNIYKIARTQGPPPSQVVTGTVIFQRLDMLRASDPPNLQRPGTRQKEFIVNLTAGKTYGIDLKASSSMFDPYLRLEDVSGKLVLAEDDDSGGNLDARIIFKCNQTRPYRVVATSFQPNQVGGFQLTVTEIGGTGGPAGKNPPVVTKLEPPKVELPKVEPKTSGDSVAAPARTVGSLTVTDLKVNAKQSAPCLCWSADGKAFFFLDTTGIVRRIRHDKFVEEASLDAGFRCSWLSMSKEGLLLTVSDRQEVWLLDPVTLKLKKAYQAPSVERGVSAPTLSVVLAAGNNLLTAIDLKTGEAKQYMPRDFTVRGGVGFQYATVSPDGKYLFAFGGIEQLQRFGIDGTDVSFEEAGPRLGNGQSISVSPDSKYVCLPAGGGNSGNHPDHPPAPSYSTYIYPTNNLNRPDFVVNQGAYPRTVGFDPRGEKIYAQNFEKQLIVFTYTGRKLQEYTLSPRGDEPRQFLAHPEGQRVLVLTRSNLFYVDLNRVQ